MFTKKFIDHCFKIPNKTQEELDQKRVVTIEMDPKESRIHNVSLNGEVWFKTWDEMTAQAFAYCLEHRIRPSWLILE